LVRQLFKRDGILLKNAAVRGKVMLMQLQSRVIFERICERKM
jgi:hypothetical protein